MYIRWNSFFTLCSPLYYGLFRLVTDSWPH
nr:MAG TPA: hypothetical protein [Caudoviricetes sp.]